MITKLHIISFQIPYPADYGGVIEVFYKLMALKQAGVEVILHCFEYKGRKPSAELEKYASKVYYYKRKTGIKPQLSLLPYIVRSRKNKKLENNLLKDDYPILFEGLHTCFLLNNPLFAKRKKIVRTHNIEHNYYKGLACASKNLKNKIFYLVEAFKLRRFEKQLAFADNIFAISLTDTEYFKKKFPKVEVNYLPCFFNNEITSIIDTQSIETKIKPQYILFNADLSVESNVKVALFLLEKVMPLVNNEINLVIAGRNPLKILMDKVNKHPSTQLLTNLSQEKMTELINNATINLLLAFQSTGVKLKLLTTLWHSQWHCLANGIMMQGTNLQNVCPVADTAQEIADKINSLLAAPFSREEITKRRENIIKCGYNNNVSPIITL